MQVQVITLFTVFSIVERMAQRLPEEQQIGYG